MGPQVHVVGARPNFIKAAPVVSALTEGGADPLLVHTGQHYEPALSQVFFDQLGIPAPERNLGVGSGSQGTQTAALLIALENLMIELEPSRVVVYGDVNSTLAASLAAAKLNVPVAHIEAGLRSFDRTMPEEINRVVTDAIADLHFTTSPEASDNLVYEGVSSEGIHFVGNPMIDTLMRFRDQLDSTVVWSVSGLDGDYAVCTVHRPANVDDPIRAGELVSALGRVAEKIPVVLPLHPRGRAILETAGLHKVPGVTVCEPLGYLEFMSLLTHASLVLTDSGGVQEETTVLGVPCLTLRENTERPITVSMGTNRLVGHSADAIVEAAIEVLTSPPEGRVPPLWDGGAGGRIADVLRR